MPHSGDRRGIPAWSGWLIAPVFLLLAAWMYAGPELVELPETPAHHVDPAELSFEARRQPLTDPPTILNAGFEQSCNSCHRLFPPKDNDTAGEARLQHTHIALNHGINDRCRNCHSRGDRDRLVMRGGKRIGYDDVVQLCSNCHGPTYRDWMRGMHGRTNGYWDASRGESVRLGCTACHDPHNPRVPAMDPLRPLPGPRSLRAEHRSEHVVVEELDPLRRVLQPHAGDHESHERSDP
ncbi:MAG: hypothetical protein GY716_06005 [bacterium]|nr:hypothetical protein [bacterium]